MEPQGSEPKESPTLAGSEPKQDTPSPEEQAKSLLTELGKIGVEKPEQIANMATASQQVGRVQNLLGTANQRIAQLEAELNASRSRKAPTEEWSSNDGQTIDLASLIEQHSGKAAERAVRKVVEEMGENQRRMYRETMAIRSDDDYGMVKDVFEPFTSTPEYMARIESGESAKDIYNEVKVKLLKEYVKRSKDTLTKLTSAATPGKADIPHVEGNETRSIPRMEPDDEKSEKLRKIEEQRRSGRMRSDLALEDMIKTLLPADDPIWGAR